MPRRRPATYKAKETRLAIGGLMRCCTGSLADWVNGQGDESIEVGTVVECKYEAKDPTKMILGADGVWRWNNK